MATKAEEGGVSSLINEDSKTERLCVIYITTNRPELDTNIPTSPITVTKPIPYTFDLGNLLCNDSNPLPEKPTDAQLTSTARDCAQALINQLLTTCPITSHPTDGVLLTLPPPTTLLPREKPLPAEKEPTKWEKFAKKKGIKDKKKGEGKMVYEEETGEWVPKWGYKGRNKDGEGDWIVEVDEKKEKKVEGKGDGSTVRGEGRRERKEMVRRNERKQRANERNGRKAGTTT
ncbi:Rhodanese- sulfurtransferase [Xylographa trunciseda]|nr:Rhodanese- sulfurtransferase [Xylographa trunciseda]